MSDAKRTHDPLLYDSKMANRASAAWLLGLLCGAVVLIALGGEPWRLALRYERLAVLDAREYWRLITAHLVHGSFTHLALNLAGLALIGALFPRHFSPLGWLAILASSVASIDAGFVWNEPQLQWYVGLSGVLHGGLAAGAIAWWRYESKGLAFALTGIFVIKLAWEQWQGALPLSGDMPVIVDAHLYGAIGGALAGALILLKEHRWPRLARPL
jgi:rhomboid family GlyGly-CTERM serine protease